MVPNFFVIFDEIPLTPNGKIDTQLLSSLDVNVRLLVDEYVAPENETEEKLCEIWKEVLNLDKVGVKDNFFKIGGDSILAIRVVSKTNNTLKISLSIKDLFEFPTIRDIFNRKNMYSFT
jgi:acyl carrier protein